MRIAIAEDAPFYAQTLQEYIRQYETEQGCKLDTVHYPSGEDLQDAFQNQFDLILLDVAMGGINGLETARQIRKLDSEVVIIFITNLAQYAINGYEVDALDYILKPVSYFTFSQRLTRALVRIRSREKKYIMISDRNGSRRLNLDEIYYVDRQGHNLIYHTASGDHSVIGTLKEAEDLLAQSHFFRCNSGYLVSLKHVESVKDGCAIVNGEALLISRSRKRGFMEALTDYIGGNAV